MVRTSFLSFTGTSAIRHFNWTQDWRNHLIERTAGHLGPGQLSGTTQTAKDLVQLILIIHALKEEKPQQIYAKEKSFTIDIKCYGIPYFVQLNLIIQTSVADPGCFIPNSGSGSENFLSRFRDLDPIFFLSQIFHEKWDSDLLFLFLMVSGPKSYC
jgi:hypothetical protein